MSNPVSPVWILIFETFVLLTASFDRNLPETWLTYDIASLDSVATQSIIQAARQQLKDDGLFIIPQFLTEDVRNMIDMELKTADHIPRKTTRTVFQDKGSSEYDTKHTRNFMFDNSMEFVSKPNIEKYINKNKVSSFVISLYEYEPLLTFWRTIINSTELYKSTDEAGSVYGFYGTENDWFSWHYDESPFSCIWMIQKPLKGGFFRYIVMENPLKQTTSKWNELDIVLTNEDVMINNGRIKDVDGQVNEGDVYCVFGSQTLHEVTKIEGNRDRSVFVMTYGRTEHFEHTHNVHDLNQWEADKIKDEL